MQLLNPDNPVKSDRHKRLYAYCELACTVVGFLAAALFGMRPTLRLYRELGCLRLESHDDIAKG